MNLKALGSQETYRELPGFTAEFSLSTTPLKLLHNLGRQEHHQAHSIKTVLSRYQNWIKLQPKRKTKTKTNKNKKT